jgi:polysaccharide biosynthesis/export protein
LPGWHSFCLGNRQSIEKAFPFINGEKAMDCSLNANNIEKKIAAFLVTLCLLTLSGCAWLSPTPTSGPLAGNGFQVEPPKKQTQFASPEKIKAVTPKGEYSYHLGPGDVMAINVWQRPELSNDQVVVGPDGVISVTRIGNITVRNRTLSEVKEEITAKLAHLYERPEVTIRVKEFQNNKAFVLGRVTKPGVVNFPGQGTLLEALALAGGLPSQQGKETFKEAVPSKCSVIRGRDTVIWIDLRDLLNNGTMALNIPVKNNDVVFIPESEDEMVFVMGEVAKPGPIQLKRGMNLVEAVMTAGGPTNGANPNKVFVLRQQGEKGDVKEINLKGMLESGDYRQNFALQSSDIVYVCPSGVHKFNYAMEQLMPTLRVLSLMSTIANPLGFSNAVVIGGGSGNGNSGSR